MATDSIFRIHSMAKPSASTGLMMRVEDGKVQPTDPISKFLPAFKNPMVSTPTFDPVFGGVSTAGDWLRHCQAMPDGGQLDGVRILSRSTVQRMTADHLGPVLAAPPVDPGAQPAARRLPPGDEGPGVAGHRGLSRSGWLHRACGLPVDALDLILVLACTVP